MIIRFYDVEDTTELKDVPGLVVKGIGDSEPLDVIENVSLNQIELPLRVDANSTSFSLLRRLTPTSAPNTDFLDFTYTPQEVFVSRACGFIANYDSLEANLATTPPDTLWIKGISLQTTRITISDTTHVKIFH